MIVIVEKVQVKAMKYIFPFIKTMSESIVILSSCQFTAVTLTQKLLDGPPDDSLVPLVVCAGWASKVPTQEKGYNKGIP